MLNLFSILDDRARTNAQDLALVDRRRSLSFAQLRAAAEKLAGELERAGVRQCDKVAVLFPRGVEEVVAGFAVARLGAIAVQISPASTAAEIDHTARKLLLDAVVCDPGLSSMIPADQQNSARQISWAELAFCLQRYARSTTPEERQHLASRNVAAIGFSSGTTSESKAILLSHQALMARGRTELHCFPVDAREGVLYLLSITYPFAPQLVSALSNGATLLIADAGAPRELEKIVRTHDVSLVYAAPLNYRMLLNGAAGVAEILRKARFLISTGSRLPDAMQEDYRHSVGQEIVNRYGLNECGMVCANVSRNPDKRGSIGTSAALEIKLVGEASESQAAETVGEMLVRGPTLFEGYSSPWRSRDDYSIDGWFRTGDVVKRDSDGYYWIVGRIKEMINVGGLKVIPGEIEDVLLGHPQIDEAVVFGAADPRFGEVPHAKIKLVPGSRVDEASIRRYVRERLAFYKSPRAIEFVDQLPRTASGKIKRAV